MNDIVGITKLIKTTERRMNMPALGLLSLILFIIMWFFSTSLFGKKFYDGAKKIYDDLTEEEPVENPGEETKGEQEN